MARLRGEIHAVYLDYQFDGWVIYGHVSDDEALDAVRSYMHDAALLVGSITRGYERVIPSGGDDGGPYLVACRGPARGATAVTWVAPREASP